MLTFISLSKSVCTNLPFPLGGIQTLESVQYHLLELQMIKLIDYFQRNEILSGNLSQKMNNYSIQQFELMVSAQILALTIYICIFINFLSFIDLNFFYMWKIRASRSEPDCNNYMGKYHKRVYHHIYSVQSECILSYFSRV